MSAHYQVTDFDIYASLDSWEEGDQGGEEYATAYENRITADSVESLLEKIAEHVCCSDKNNIVLNQDGNPGMVMLTIDTRGPETGDWSEIDERETERWKRGEIKVWSARFRCVVERVETVELPEIEGYENESGLVLL